MKTCWWRRGLAFVIDWNLIIILTFALSLLGPRFDVNYLLYPSVRMFSSYGLFLAISAFAFLPLFRDILLGGRSLGKRIFRLKIVSASGEAKVSTGKMILRNITFYFWPVDLIFSIFSRSESLGDKISKTKVVCATAASSGA